MFDPVQEKLDSTILPGSLNGMRLEELENPRGPAFLPTTVLFQILIWPTW